MLLIKLTIKCFISKPWAFVDCVLIYNFFDKLWFNMFLAKNSFSEVKGILPFCRPFYLSMLLNIDNSVYKPSVFKMSSGV